MLVEVPVEFRGGGPVTLAIEIDTDGILSAANAPGCGEFHTFPPRRPTRRRNEIKSPPCVPSHRCEL